MHLLNIFNNKIIKHDLVNKYHYKNIQNLPKLKKITLNFNCTNFNTQKFATTLLAFRNFNGKEG
jgi:ribosomal protein L5